MIPTITNYDSPEAFLADVRKYNKSEMDGTQVNEAEQFKVSFRTYRAALESVTAAYFALWFHVDNPIICTLCGSKNHTKDFHK